MCNYKLKRSRLKGMRYKGEIVAADITWNCIISTVASIFQVDKQTNFTPKIAIDREIITQNSALENSAERNLFS